MLNSTLSLSARPLLSDTVLPPDIGPFSSANAAFPYSATMPWYSHCMFQPGSGHPRQDARLCNHGGLVFMGSLTIRGYI
jgi:hypothetical protein